MQNFIEDVNVSQEIKKIIENIPKDLTVLEKIRWIYIRLGKIFSYDFRIISNPEISKNTVDLSNNFISKYETCVQISYILNNILNNVDGCKCDIIDREIDIRGHNGKNHKANVVTLDTGEKFLLDLTLDLYLIQSGCQTKEFGFTTDKYGTYDIISLFECKNLDKKLGFNINYLDKEIEELKGKIYNKSLPEQIQVVNEFLKKIEFSGYHEMKRFIDKILFEVLKVSYKEYNLKYVLSDSMKLYTCFKILNNNESIFCLFNDNNELNIVERVEIIKMLDEGWTTKSESLVDELNRKIR